MSRPLSGSATTFKKLHLNKNLRTRISNNKSKRLEKISEIYETNMTPLQTEYDEVKSSIKDKEDKLHGLNNSLQIYTQYFGEHGDPKELAEFKKQVALESRHINNEKNPLLKLKKVLERKIKDIHKKRTKALMKHLISSGGNSKSKKKMQRRKNTTRKNN